LKEVLSLRKQLRYFLPITGYRIVYSPWKGVFLGPKSSGPIEEAMEREKSSALVWKLNGDSKLLTPGMFGGDINESIKAYQKAINCMNLIMKPGTIGYI